MPERTPLNAQIFGRAERPDFTVDKGRLRERPRSFRDGPALRPKGKSGRLPAVLSPHGHEGRLWDYGGEGRSPPDDRDGQERFERSGRFPQLARCATLARLGCVVFIHDMLGYADSVQIPTAVAHRFAKQRPELDTPNAGGFFGVQAELRLQSILGVQAWNALRALDFLASLARRGPGAPGRDGVQRRRNAGPCSSAARGFRVPAVSFPSGDGVDLDAGWLHLRERLLPEGRHGQCPNSPGSSRPKPQAMTAANDWTKEMMTKGFPELEKLYGLAWGRKNGREVLSRRGTSRTTTTT